MSSTLRQQFSPSLLTEVLQHVQLLIKSFGSTPHAGFLDLSQPLVSLAAVLDVPAPTGDRPAAIHSFQPAPPFVGDYARAHNLLPKGRPFKMRYRQLSQCSAGLLRASALM
jgi:hypothetical protein